MAIFFHIFVHAILVHFSIQRYLNKKEQRILIAKLRLTFFSVFCVDKFILTWGHQNKKISKNIINVFFSTDNKITLNKGSAKSTNQYSLPSRLYFI